MWQHLYFIDAGMEVETLFVKADTPFSKSSCRYFVILGFAHLVPFVFYSLLSWFMVFSMLPCPG